MPNKDRRRKLQEKELNKLNAARSLHTISGSYVLTTLFILSVRSKWQKNERNDLLHYRDARE